MKNADFKRVLKKHFAPKMKELGYNQLTDISWNKKGADNYVFSIAIDFGSGGGYCHLEYGIHLDFIPLGYGTEKPILEKTDPMMSMFRGWLTNTLNDRHDFIYADKEGAELICDYLFWAVQDQAEMYFANYANFPAPFAAITAEDLKNGVSYGQFRFPGDFHPALQLARINLFLGNQARANEFADYGISLITDHRGSALIPHFEKIKEGVLYY